MLLLILLSVANAADLEWTDPVSGSQFSFESLQKPEDDPWIVYPSSDLIVSTKYYFNFGTSLKQQCSGQYVGAIEVIELWDEIFESCDILGRQEMTSYGLINPNNPQAGFKITYGGGDLCSESYEGLDSIKRAATFKLHCSNYETEWEVVEESGFGYCHVFLTKNTPAGCPVTSTFHIRKEWWYLAGFLGFVWVYFAGGIIINSIRGIRGSDAIPHYKFFEGLLEKIQGIFGSVFVKAKEKYMIAKEKIAKKNTSYEMV
ncbi:unnamed protein product [Blepharisma stoltei]|uniref:Autophagy-related protein 27 n=1 Tax=Blepharisma stoltei TaxID=1481888 RepID=A0AAU9J9I7_9CILI|nr:unnamed protein product [Blepharisma stoltei]